MKSFGTHETYEASASLRFARKRKCQDEAPVRNWFLFVSAARSLSQILRVRWKHRRKAAAGQLHVFHLFGSLFTKFTWRGMQSLLCTSAASAPCPRLRLSLSRLLTVAPRMPIPPSGTSFLLRVRSLAFRKQVAPVARRACGGAPSRYGTRPIGYRRQ